MNTSDREFKVGQKVRVEDVQEGIVTEVGSSGYICVDGRMQCTNGTNGTMSRTITILSEPKPDEPKLLGAVVRDAHGDVWSMAADGSDQPWTLCDGNWDWRDWDNIDAVEVLFPGVES